MKATFATGFRFWFLPLLCLSALSHAAGASTLTVPAQYATIQAAITASVDGDTVLISDGTYTGPGNVDLDFGGRNITVRSVNGPNSTIIDCQGSSSVNHRGFYLHSGETSAVISGLTIENGYEGDGGGIWNDNVSVTVQNCIFKNNTASQSRVNSGDGGAIVYYSGSGGGISNNNFKGDTITVSNCTLTGDTANSNYVGGSGGGIYNFSRGGTISVTNCTLTGNTVSGAGGGLYNDNAGKGTITLTNDILYGDTGGEIAKSPYSTSNAIATYCDVQGGYAGTGNIDADPLFVNAPIDLHLQPGSPCLGAGTPDGAPTTTIDGQMRPDPPSIGAYEVGQALASLRTYRFIVSGGSVVSLTAALTQKADSDATLTLISSDPAALSVPSSVLIRMGYTTKTFTATSHLVTKPILVTVTATYNGITKTATVTVTP